MEYRSFKNYVFVLLSNNYWGCEIIVPKQGTTEKRTNQYKMEWRIIQEYKALQFSFYFINYTGITQLESIFYQRIKLIIAL